MNLPRSRRLAYSDNPMPSCQRILARSPRRRGRYRDPGMGIALQALLNRQSQALHAAAHVRVPVAIQTLTPLGIGIIVGSEHRGPAQRLSVDILVNADALAVTELDLDQATSLPGRHRRWVSIDRTLSAAAAAT